MTGFEVGEQHRQHRPSVNRQRLVVGFDQKICANSEHKTKLLQMPYANIPYEHYP